MIKFVSQIFFKLHPNIRRFIKFAMVGTTGSLIALAILYILVEFFNWDKYVAWLLGVIIGFFFNFVLNSIFTWRERKANSKSEIFRRLSLYYLFAFMAIGLNLLIYHFLLKAGIYYILSASITIVIVAGFNFTLANFVVWRPAKN